MPLESGTPLRIDSEALRKTSVLGLMEGGSRDLFDSGYASFDRTVRYPRSSFDQNLNSNHLYEERLYQLAR